MQIDLNLLAREFKDVPSEETVPIGETNPYLLNEVLMPILRGVNLKYGDIDYSKFEADDLRVLSYYCDNRDSVSSRLRDLSGKFIEANAAACRIRVYC